MSTADWIEALRPVLRGDDAREGSAGVDKKDLLAVGRPKARPPSSLLLPFEPHSATLTQESKARVDRLGAALTSDALMAFAFRLECFPTLEPQKAVDDALFARRTNAVVEYLVERAGVARDRLEAVRGRREPIATAKSDTDGLLVIITNMGE